MMYNKIVFNKQELKPRYYELSTKCNTNIKYANTMKVLVVNHSKYRAITLNTKQTQYN